MEIFNAKLNGCRMLSVICEQYKCFGFNSVNLYLTNQKAIENITGIFKYDQAPNSIENVLVNNMYNSVFHNEYLMM